MDLFAPFHPQIVHTPIALIIFSLLFEIVGRATDAGWLRKAALATLVLGVLGAGAAVLSGDPAADRAEERQKISEETIESHENAGKMTLWIGIGAVAARAIGAAMGGAGGARSAVAVIAFLLHALTAVTVGIAGYRGGELVFKHGAGVHVVQPGPTETPTAPSATQRTPAADAGD